MEPGQKRDAMCSAAIASSLPIAVLVLGDPLYIGLWYYLVIPAIVIGIGILLDAPPPYLTGASLALAATFLFFMLWNWTATRPDGLAGLGHLLSLPGALIGFLAAIRLARRSSKAPVVLALGCAGWLGGFLLNCALVLHSA